MPYVYSTLTGDQIYQLYAPKIDFKKIPKPKRKVFIAGGSNVIDKHMHTPRGVVTEVSADELNVLEQVKGFQRHRSRGFITVDDKSAPPEKVAKSMTPKDKSAQLEDSDFEKDKKPIVNKDDG